mmetsp:Transcript_20636/g.65851  ORF Transcript_20636/g.65851 Transcript_20636/m.65851 type:complete len:261 (-) Transcript_20636:2505-3287(-)
MVVLGWWMSKPAHVHKYAQLFGQHTGVRAVVQETMTTEELLLRPLRDKAARRVIRHIAKARRKVAEEDGEAPRIVFHAFSNNGALLFQSVQSQLPHDMSSAVAGTVFDSCPGDLTLNVWVGAVRDAPLSPAVTSAAGGAGILGFLALRLAVGSTVTFAKLVAAGLIGSKVLEYAITKRYHDEFVGVPLRCPQLFLFSNEDTLVSSARVEDLARRRQEAGVPNVRLHRFNGSGHVAHFREHPEEYRDVVFGFLDTMCAGSD